VIDGLGYDLQRIAEKLYEGLWQIQRLRGWHDPGWVERYAACVDGANIAHERGIHRSIFSILLNLLKPGYPKLPCGTGLSGNDFGKTLKSTTSTARLNCD
jgi:hypothetical protein